MTKLTALEKLRRLVSFLVERSELWRNPAKLCLDSHGKVCRPKRYSNWKDPEGEHFFTSRLTEEDAVQIDLRPYEEEVQRLLVKEEEERKAQALLQERVYCLI